MTTDPEIEMELFLIERERQAERMEQLLMVFRHMIAIGIGIVGGLAVAIGIAGWLTA